jgi:hypothetical protein
MAIPDIDWDRVYVSNFTMKLLTSREWFSTANELIAAAEVLSPHVIAWWNSLMEWSKGQGIFLEHGYHSTFLMLYAFAMENLCKGYLVSRFSLKALVACVRFAGAGQGWASAGAYESFTSGRRTLKRSTC